VRYFDSRRISLDQRKKGEGLGRLSLLISVLEEFWKVEFLQVSKWRQD